MTLREVAEYLKLSEKAVSRMAQEGRIPAQKLARQWRFQRDLINSWMIDPNRVPADQQQLPPESTGMSQPLTVASVITPAHISLNLTAPDKNGVLRELCALVIDPREERLPDAGMIKLRDAETGAERWIDSGVARVRMEFEKFWQVRRAARRGLFLRSKVDAIPIRVDRPYIKPIVDFFQLRAKRW